MSIWNKFFNRTPVRQVTHRSGAELGVFGNDRMTVEQLLAEGDRLKRHALLLKASGHGKPVAWWHHAPNRDPELRPDYEPWLTIDSGAIPGDPNGAVPGLITVFTSRDDRDGRIDPVDHAPDGIPLFGHRVEVIAPLEAVFQFGSDRVRSWLEALDWNPSFGHSKNFPDAAITGKYMERWFRDCPLYSGDRELFAALGGWHPFTNDEDWEELVPERLLALTLRDSEPWVEAWATQSGELRVMQRIT